MAQTLGHFFGFAIALSVIAMLLVNGAYMLLAPKRWITSERWFLFPGRLKLDEANQKGRRATEISFGGLVLLTSLGYLIYDFFKS